MIRYEVTNDDDGINNLVTLINGNNNTRIIVTDDELRELAALVYKIIALSDLPETHHD